MSEEAKKKRELEKIADKLGGEVKQELDEIKKIDKKEILEKISEEEYLEARDKLNEAHFLIKKVLRKYCDLDEKYYNLISLWIIGTYFHKSFLTYPYLFFNAMRGSGKTRILNLISKLMKNGKLQVNMTEAVLFRTAEFFGFCIDELERISSKEKAPFRELLNSAYKQGMCIERVKKKKIDGEEQYIVETHNVFTPIAMANIYGMNDVLADRSITIILEKTQNDTISRMVELFDFDDDIIKIKEILSAISVVISRYRGTGIYYNNWNNYITTLYNYNNDINSTNYTNIKEKEVNNQINNNIYTTTLNNITTLKQQKNTQNQHTQPVIETTLSDITNNTNIFYEKITHTQIIGRDLELFFPLFIIAHIIGDEVLDETLQTASSVTNEKKEEEYVESKDINLVDFLASRLDDSNFTRITTLVTEFKEFLQESDEEIKWINSYWLGRALKRLKLIKKKRRLARGREVILNTQKAKQKMKLFKTMNMQKIEAEAKEQPVELSKEIKEDIKKYENKTTDKVQQNL